MHIRNYHPVVFFLTPIIYLVAFIPEQDVLNSLECSALWLLVVLIGSYPFLEFDIDAEGIAVYQFARKKCFFPWEKIKTVGVLPGANGCRTAYVSFAEKYAVEQILKKIKFYGLSNKYCLNLVLCKKNGLNMTTERPFLYLGCTYDPEPTLKKIIQQNRNYVKKYDGQPASIYRF